jgi:hypothetical protein
MSSLLYTNFQAVVKLEGHISDLTDAIERVEILRDEPLLNMDLMQSGVMNIILKKPITDLLL